jgi:hypothetical protein
VNSTQQHGDIGVAVLSVIAAGATAKQHQVQHVVLGLSYM